jgi:hypothetical protein
MYSQSSFFLSVFIRGFLRSLPPCSVFWAPLVSAVRVFHEPDK